MQLPIVLLQLLVFTFQVHLSTCEANNCYPDSHICPFNNSDIVSGLVTPTLPPSGCDSRSNCQLLECYLTCLNNNSYTRISLYFLPGLHQGKNLEVYTSIRTGLTIIGVTVLGELPQIHLTNFKLFAKLDYTCVNSDDQCYSSVYMNDLVASNVDIVAHCYLGSPCSTEISNSIFNEVSIILSNAVVSIYNIQFHNSTSTAFTAYFCRVTIESRVSFFNNTGTNGGAMSLIGSLLQFSNRDVTFRQNRARQNGGAIYIDSTNELGITSCFYGIYIFGNSNDSIVFKENSAVVSGNHIYGASMKSTCLDYSTNMPSYQIVKKHFEFNPDVSETLSGISGEPSRVCTCQGNLTPQCANPAKVINQEILVYPGESLTIDCVVVGGDFGITTGTVYANIEIFDNSTDYVPTLEAPYMYNYVISETQECSKLQYTILSNNTGLTIMLVLRTTETTTSRVPDNIAELCDRYNTEQVITPELINTPVVIPLTIKPCPAGFTLKENTQDRCDCYIELYSTLGSATCSIQNGHGYVSWNASTWLSGIAKGIESIGIAYSKYCPIDNCNSINEMVDLQNDPDAQCAFNHQGRLCGGCKENHSLAIGSSHCIYCPNNNGLSLIIFFAAAGFLLIAAICSLNLTVTDGKINGLIFYANVIWAYQHVLFPQNVSGYLQFLRVFIAWINLDFGIETCFIVGLDAFWKTWLQFAFPIYSAGIFFIGLRYSDHLSKFLGSRSLHTFATLFFLSNTKLLRTIIAALKLAEVKTYPDETAYFVWAVDGNLLYGHFPHILLLMVSIFCLVFFWIPYALLFFSMQWLRRVDHHGPLKYIGKQKPLIDAHLAPLRDKHHYWFGILLLSLGIILIVSSLSLNVLPILSEYLLIVIAVLLIWYSNNTHVYRKRYVLMIESTFLMNLILLFVGLQYGISRPTLMTVSLSIAFFEFCGLICWNTLSYIPKRMGFRNLCPECYEHYRDLSKKLQYTDDMSDDDKLHKQEKVLPNIPDTAQRRETLLDHTH